MTDTLKLELINKIITTKLSNEDMLKINAILDGPQVKVKKIKVLDLELEVEHVKDPKKRLKKRLTNTEKMDIYCKYWDIKPNEDLSYTLVEPSDFKNDEKLYYKKLEKYDEYFEIQKRIILETANS
jgi:hypothetical protein